MMIKGQNPLNNVKCFGYISKYKDYIISNWFITIIYIDAIVCGDELYYGFFVLFMIVGYYNNYIT